MFSEEQKRIALETYDRTRSVGWTMAELGYPSRSCLKYWIAQRKQQPRTRRRALRFTFREKEAAVLRVLAGEHPADVAGDIGCTDQAVRNWRRIYIEEGVCSLMGRYEKPAPAPLPEDLEALPDDVDELKALAFRLKFENDLMREVAEIVKKDRGADPRTLTNREKAALIDAMRATYSLSFLASELEIPLSGYHYARNAAATGRDRWAEARRAVVEEFEACGRSRGYRYIRRRLSERGIACGERTVRRLMAEEGCTVVYLKAGKKWSSYAGEVTEAPANLVARDFHAAAPNELWVTDITEFKLPGPDAAKVYLSVVVDRFDGMVAAWSAGTSPDARLANSSLEAACEGLSAGQAPVVHSDRGGHYRWPGWISICGRHGLTRSMSAKGCSPDNAACEGFFGRLKNEFFRGRDWSGVGAGEFIERLCAWLEYYNGGRIKESLGWMSPRRYRESLGLAA